MRRILKCLMLALVLLAIGCQPIEASAFQARETPVLTPIEQAQVDWYWHQQLTHARQWFAAQVHFTQHAVCVRGHESDTAGGYAAFDGDNNFGAYQFDMPTWNSVVARMGRPDLVGVPPLDPVVPWWDQDIAYASLYIERGDRPWGGMC